MRRGPEPAIGEKSPEDRSEIDEAAVPAEDQRGEGLVGNRPAELEKRPQWREAEDVPGMIGKQQLLDEVERE